MVAIQSALDSGTGAAARRRPYQVYRAGLRARQADAEKTMRVMHSQIRLVHVAPAPVLAGLKRADERVRRGMEVFRRVPVFGRVAAADMAAGQTQPEVHPAIPGLQAILAALCARLD